MDDLNHSRKLAAGLFAATLLLADATSALAKVHYVDVNGANPTPPYTNWITAATNIQDAVDATVAGDEIVVTNGVYAAGGRSIDGITTNRVTVDSPLTLRSVNGPLLTIIDGGQSNRCVYLANHASLSGFTLTSGFAPDRGGGVFCETSDAVVSNCVVSHNLGGDEALGGGVYGGTLNNCTLSSNSCYRASSGVFTAESFGGGASGSTLNNCILTGNSASVGGGAHQCLLSNCKLNDSLAFGGLDLSTSRGMGGGAASCTLNNCTLSGNSAIGFGGAAIDSALSNCSLDGNFANLRGGGSYGCKLTNCIVYFNSVYYLQPAVTANYDSSSILSYCCTTPQPANGQGNITNAPLFVDQASADLRLQSNSACINAGNNSFAVGSTDLDGNPRIVGYTVDMGAYEFQLPLPQLTIITSGTNVILAWPTDYAEVVIQEDRYEAYFLYSTTNLVSPAVWSFVYTTPVVVDGRLVVTNAIAATQRFYRLAKVTGPLSDVPCLGSGPNPCPCAFTCVSGVWKRFGTCRTCGEP